MNRASERVVVKLRVPWQREKPSEFYEKRIQLVADAYYGGDREALRRDAETDRYFIYKWPNVGPKTIAYLRKHG